MSIVYPVHPAVASLFAPVTCATPGCSRTFVSQNVQHRHCSRVCRRRHARALARLSGAPTKEVRTNDVN